MLELFGYFISVPDIMDAVGMIGFAIAGLMAVQNRRIDPVGVFVACFTTAFGGGIIRDIMLDLRPFYWMSHPQWIWFCLVLTIFAPPLIRRMREGWSNQVYLWADAIGLAFFTIGSCATAWSLDQNAFVSVLLGVVTGCFGGMLRDVFLDKLPGVLSDRQPYAAIAFAGAWIYLGMIEWMHIPVDPAMWIATVLIIAGRMGSVYFPIFRVAYDEEVGEKGHDDKLAK